MMDDLRVVIGQLGREPRGSWRPVARCRFDRPTVIVTAPVLEDGSPFPTLYYLTCPHLAGAVAALEAAGGTAAWADRLAADPEIAARLRDADDAYRTARAAENDGVDPTPQVGIAGQRDPLGTKCLHAHVAACLAGIDDPVGAGVLAAVSRECDDDRCRERER